MRVPSPQQIDALDLDNVPLNTNADLKSATVAEMTNMMKGTCVAFVVGYIIQKEEPQADNAPHKMFIGLQDGQVVTFENFGAHFTEAEQGDLIIIMNGIVAHFKGRTSIKFGSGTAYFTDNIPVIIFLVATHICYVILHLYISTSVHYVTNLLYICTGAQDPDGRLPLPHGRDVRTHRVCYSRGTRPRGHVVLPRADMYVLFFSNMCMHCMYVFITCLCFLDDVTVVMIDTKEGANWIRTVSHNYDIVPFFH